MSFTSKPCPTLTAAAAAYPKVFKGDFLQNGALAMLMVGDVIPTRIETINAHAFSLGVQSSASCRECGTMFEELPDAGNPYVCKQCQLSDSKHET